MQVKAPRHNLFVAPQSLVEDREYGFFLGSLGALVFMLLLIVAVLADVI